MAAERSVLVFGAGSVGAYLGGKLAASTSLRITLLGRALLAEAVARRGLVLREAGREAITRPAAVTSLDGLGTVDLVMLTVRTYDVERAVPDLLLAAGQSGLVLAFQNGVGTDDRLTAVFSRHRVLAGTITVRPGMDEPGVITRYSRSGGIALATLDGSPVPDWIAEAFTATGLPTVVIGDYRRLRWSKLLLNMLGAASSAILDIDLDVLAAHPGLFRIEQLAFREAARVMDAQGIRSVSLPGYPVSLGRLAMRLPRPLAQRLIGPRLAKARGGHSPGMRDDIKRGRTEVDSFNGAVVRAALRERVTAPVNAALTDLTHELCANPERRPAFRHNPAALLAYMHDRGIRV